MLNNIFEWFNTHAIRIARLSFFIVFFWYGILKVIGVSQAEGLVQALYNRSFEESANPSFDEATQVITFDQGDDILYWKYNPFRAFIIFFGIYEMVIGIFFLIRGRENIALYLLFPHMITTFGPLVLLPEVSWKAFMVPTLTGHYIIKNLVLIALAILVAAYEWKGNQKQSTDLSDSAK